MTSEAEIGRKIARLLEGAAERLEGHGVSRGDIARAMVAVGIKLWTEAEGADTVAQNLVHVTGGFLDLTGLAVEDEAAARAKH